MSHHIVVPCRLRYRFSTFEIVSSESSDAFSCRVESDWQPPGKAINTTICGVITLEAFTFNFSTVSSCAAEALLGRVRACVLPCDLDSTQFTNLFSQMQLTYIQITTRNNSTLIWILSASFAYAGWLCEHWKKARTHVRIRNSGRQFGDGHRENFTSFLR